MSHESATSKPHPSPLARAATQRRRAKLFAVRFVSILCAALAVALTAAQGSRAYQDPDPAQSPTDTQSPAAAATQSPPATPTPTPTPYPDAKVKHAYKLGREHAARYGTTAEKKAAAEAGLNDIIVLDVENLKGLLERSQCLAPGGEKDADCDVKQRRIILYIEGRPLKGLTPESGAPELKEGEDGTLRYHLQRPEQSDQVTESEVKDTNEHWADLLGLSYDDARRGRLWSRPVSMSVGIEGDYPVPTDVRYTEQIDNRFNLLRLRWERLLIWAVLLGGFLVGFWKLARHSDIIRDRKPIVWKRGNTQRKAYSLTRTQIAWWTFFVAYGFIFIWLVTGQRALSQSVLMLLGISVITTTASIAIDKSRSFVTAGEDTGDTSDDLAKLMHEKERLEQELIRGEQKLRDEPDKNGDAYKAIEADFKKNEEAYKTLVADIRRRFPTALGWDNVRFDRDILSDANGVSIHRFQMVLWTVVLGGIFIYEVLTRLAMPDFDPTLLLLMGISNGTYLFGKSSEPQATPPPTEDATEETADGNNDGNNDETGSPP